MGGSSLKKGGGVFSSALSTRLAAVFTGVAGVGDDSCDCDRAGADAGLRVELGVGFGVGLAVGLDANAGALFATISANDGI